MLPSPALSWHKGLNEGPCAVAWPPLHSIRRSQLVLTVLGTNGPSHVVFATDYPPVGAKGSEDDLAAPAKPSSW